MRNKFSRLALLITTALPVTSCSTYKLTGEYRVEADVYSEITTKFNSQLTKIMQKYDTNHDGIISKDEARIFLDDIDKALKLFELINKKAPADK